MGERRILNSDMKRNYELHEIEDSTKSMEQIASQEFAACATNGDELCAALRRVASRHCERSEAIQGTSLWKANNLDCFVVPPRNDANGGQCRHCEARSSPEYKSASWIASFLAMTRSGSKSQSKVAAAIRTNREPATPKLSEKTSVKSVKSVVKQKL